MELKWSYLDRFHRLDGEIQSDGLFDPFIDGPFAGSDLIGYPNFPLVEQADAFEDGVLGVPFFQEGPVVPGGFDDGLEWMHIQSSLLAQRWDFHSAEPNVWLKGLKA